MIAFLLAGAGVAATALFGAAALRLPSFSEFLLAGYVLATAEVVAAGEVLSLADAISIRGYAAFEAGAFILVLGTWLGAGRPRPSNTVLLGRGVPVLVALGLVVAAAVGYETFVGFFTPPNNWDSMHYHLARAAQWRAQGSLDWFPTHNPIENTYPPNAELLVLYTLVFLALDALVSLPQLVAALATALGVYCIARRLGARAEPAALAALVFPTLTIVALESVQPQNDIVEASFIAAAVAFALGRRPPLAGIAIGLAVGTKLTFAFALPVLFVVLVLTLPRRRLAEVAVWSVLGVAALGSYAYAQNLIEDGSLLGSPPERELLRPDVTAAGTASTFLRTYYRLVDFSGFHAPGALTDHVAGAAKRVFDVLHVPQNPPEATTRGTFAFAFQPQAAASDDASAFGPLGFLLVVPLSLGFLVAWLAHRVDRRAGALALALPVYALVLAFGTRWNTYVDRFLVTPVALTLPLAAFVLARRWIAVPVVVLAAATAALAHAYSTSKTTGLVGRPIWDMSRVEVQTVRRRELEPALAAVERRVPKDARLGVVLARDDWEFPLWGPHLSRRLVWSRRASYVVYGHGVAAPSCAERFPASGWKLAVRC